MMKLFPNESPVGVPGVKITTPWLPCETEVIDENRSVPSSTKYVLSADKKFLEGKTYYVITPGTVADFVVATDATVGADLPSDNEKYYEKIVTPAYTGTTKTVYDRYTDGMWVDMVNGEPVYREHAVEICRTVTYVDNNVQHVIREHALGLWANRHSLEYVSIARRLESNSQGESARIFR